MKESQGETEDPDRAARPNREEDTPVERNPAVEISRSIDESTSIRVRFLARHADDSAKAAVLLYDTERQMSAARAVSEIRGICIRKSGLYYPTNRETSKMELMMLSIAANYPEGLSLDDIVSELGIERKAAHAYITSGNNWTSQYLYLDGKQAKIRETGLYFILNRIHESAQSAETGGAPVPRRSQTI